MISREDLLKFLGEIDKKVKSRTTLVAVGGTAMVLMGLKESTIDVDFCADKEIKMPKSDFKVDIFRDGYIFCLQLPPDYVRRARGFKTGFKWLNIKILSPVDVILTKGSRLNQRDIEDIREVVSKKKVDKKKLISRFNEVKMSWPGDDKVLEENFRFILREMF